MKLAPISKEIKEKLMNRMLREIKSEIKNVDSNDVESGNKLLESCHTSSIILCEYLARHVIDDSYSDGSYSDNEELNTVVMI